MKIHGIGIVSAHGRGLDVLADVLAASAPPPPSWLDVPFQKPPFPVYRVPPEVLKDPSALAGMRRADRFSKMAVLAACDAATEEGGLRENAPRTGIVFATAFGPHNTTFGFLDEILQYGDGGVSPTIFSNSVHNAAVSYISKALAITGPTWTIARFRNPFQQALLLAQTWLREGRCERVLAGAGDECGTVLEYICSQKLALAGSGDDLRPFFDPRGPRVIPGELAAFFLLSNEKSPGLQIDFRQSEQPLPDMLMMNFESRTPDPRSTSLPTGCWSHLAGANPVSAAFSCAVGSLMLRRQSPFAENNLLKGAHGVCTPEAGMPLRRIECQPKIDLFAEHS